jgi:hypothetical protein
MRHAVVTRDPLNMVIRGIRYAKTVKEKKESK